MQLVDSSPWMGLPLEIFKLIRHKAHVKHLSQVDKNLYMLSCHVTETLCICPPSFTKSAYSESILVDLIKRYPHIKKLSIGRKNRGFESSEESYLRVLNVYLSIFPLDHVKTLIFREIGGTGADESKEINRQLMQALSHIKLESISIRLLNETSILTGSEIQPILEKSLNLKKFKLRCYSNDHPLIALTFAKQAHLISANFIEFCAPAETLESVKSCSKLKSLKLSNAHHSQHIKTLLSEKASEKLTRLSIPGITIESDIELNAITKTHPNLEHLNITLGPISDEGAAIIGSNCPKLRSILLNYQTATDKGLALLSSKLASLEELWMNKGFNITGTGVAAIAKNCSKLRRLKLYRIKALDKSGIEALIKHCKSLTHVEIGNTSPIALEDIRYLAKHLTSLKLFKLSSIAGITEEDLLSLKTEFSFLI